MRDVKHSDNNATALSKHAVELGHSIDWKNYEILQIETDYHKRKFIELFYINSFSNVLNDKKSVCFPSIYQNLLSYYHHFNFLGLQRSVKIVVVRSSTILTAFVFLIVSRDLVLLRYFIFSSFDSFPDRRQVVYTVETLELQKFSQNR